jgi:acetolactate synthase I/III small subunit
MRLHTFTVHVEDRPGVLNCVSSLFRRRGYNIESLSVGHSETPGVSRMTVVVATDEGGAARLRAQLLKLIDVVDVEDISRVPSIVRDLALIKVGADHHNRGSLMQLVHVFHARVVDVSPETAVVEVCGSESKVDALLEVLRPYGVLEMVRTGRVAMARGSGARGVEAPTAPAAAEEGVSYSV